MPGRSDRNSKRSLKSSGLARVDEVGLQMGRGFCQTQGGTSWQAGRNPITFKYWKLKLLKAHHMDGDTGAAVVQRL
jgi:hypothetical protein